MINHKELSSQVVALIYAGGSGTRLWPISTEENPKQINQDISKITLVQKVYQRVRKLFPKEKIILVATRLLYKKISKLIDLPRNNFLIEPEMADTTAATMLTAMFIETYFPNSVAISYYADQIIEPDPLFLHTVKQAIAIVQKHHLFLVIGTKATSINRELGYIKLGKRTEIARNLYSTDIFIEKPSLQIVKKLINSGHAVWNTGMYIWHVPKLLSITKKIAPEIYQSLLQLKLDIGDHEFHHNLEKWYRQVKHSSFEKVISEKTDDLYVLVSSFEWKDIGTWSSLYEMKKKDKNGNIMMAGDQTNTITLQVKNCLIHSNKKETILIGLENLVIVETANKLLICHRDFTSEVKKAVELLKSKKLK